MNPLPPQAYTKDTLMKAYAWLMNQSESVREMATTPDILISLYLKTHRDGEAVLERPSIQNFKNELKSLAGLMGELEPQQQNYTHHMQNHSASHNHYQTQPQTVAAQSVSNHYQAPPVINVNVTGHQQPTQAMMATSSTSQQSNNLPPVSQSAKSNGLLSQMDAKSLAMIQEVKEDFNLSDDHEALRMLIKIGYTRAKNMVQS